MSLLDPDYAYVLGLICSRGKFLDTSNTILIEFPYKSLSIKGTISTFDQEGRLIANVLDISNKIQDIFGSLCKVERNGNTISISIKFISQNLIWRDMQRRFEGKKDYYNFLIPREFFEKSCPTPSVMHFLKGYCDLAGSIRKSNRDQRGLHRVYVDIIQSKNNWVVPVQLCSLLQNKLNIEVAHINWGHPNMKRNWKEHQIRVYAIPFEEKLGFTFDHKQTILQELATENRSSKIKLPTKFCVGAIPARRKPIKKPKNKTEENNSDYLPDFLLKRHFDGFFQICKACACKKHTKKTLQYPEI